MMRPAYGVAFAGLIASLSFWSQAFAIDPKMLALMKAPPEHFRDTVTIKDDSMETVVTFTTVNGFQEKRGLLGIVWNDNFIRAFMDKKTGTVSYQLYQTVMYEGDWRFYTSVNYETPEGLESAELVKIDSSVGGCSGYRSQCTLRETIGFPIGAQLMKEIADKYKPGSVSAWKFRMKSKAGQDWDDGVLPAEAAGLLQAIDAYKVAHPPKALTK